MEADWEVEVGGQASVIDALWPGWIDLHEAPERICAIDEAVSFPALATLLLALNSRQSPVWTSKCDVWRLEECDPFEMEATSATAQAGRAVYVDLLPRDRIVFPSLGSAEEWVRAVVVRLRRAVCVCSRVDLVIRQAVAGDQNGFGVTVYVSACGADAQEAATSLERALTTLGRALPDSPWQPPPGRWQRRKTVQ